MTASMFAKFNSRILLDGLKDEFTDSVPFGYSAKLAANDFGDRDTDEGLR